MRKETIVIGGGIQGCCIALALLQRGHRVTLLDQSESLLSRASFNQEGKIHLGFVYALDETGNTGRKMVRDGLAFAPALEQLLGKKLAWEGLRTRPFEYWVAGDSLLSPTEIDGYFRMLADYARDRLNENSDLHYLGQRDAEFYRPIEIPHGVNPERLQAAFSTMEASIDHNLIRRSIIDALIGNPDFTFAAVETVTEVQKSPAEWQVTSTCQSGEKRTRAAALVVNCSWESLDALDISAGLRPPSSEPPNLRIKIGIITAPNPSLTEINPFTIVHGAYGDFLTSPDNSSHYFCWYPVSMRGMVRSLRPPDSWQPLLRGEFSSDFIDELQQANESAFREILPDMTPWDVKGLRAGIIVARGVKDISDRKTRLHQRDDYPIHHRDDFWSISTGKFTSGPANALAFGRALDAAA
ncbi:MAG: hypothetical protein SynsKO_30870 [Synoicihabitans sp.]